MRGAEQERAAVLFLAAGLAASVAGSPASAQAIWTDFTGDGWWHTAANWSTGLVPDGNTDAVIPQGFTGVGSLGIGVRSLSAQSPLAIGGGGAVVGQGSTMRDGSITGGFTAGGEALFTGDVTVQAANSWVAAGGFRNTGTMTVFGLPISLSTFTNEGTLRVPGTFTVGGAPSTLVNNGTLELMANGNFYSGGLVANSGTFRKSGAGTSEVQCRVQLTGGSLDVTEGLLRITGSGQYTGGTISISSGAELRLEGPFQSPFTHTFSGVPGAAGEGDLVVEVATNIANPPVQIEGDRTFSLNGPVGLHLRSGNIGVMAGGTLRNAGRFTWWGGLQGPGPTVNDEGATAVIPAGQIAIVRQDGVFQNNGLFECHGNLQFSSGTVENNAGGLMRLSGELRGSATTGVVVNRGRLESRQVSTSTEAKVQVFFDQRNGGETEVMQGQLLLSGGGVLGQGRFGVAAFGSSLAFDAGAYAVNGAHAVEGGPGNQMRIRGPSIVEVQGQGSLTLVGFTPVVAADGVTLESAAQLGGAGPVFNRSSFKWIGTIGVAGQADFRNESGGQVLIPPGGSARLRGTVKNEASASGVFQQGSLDMANSAVLNTGDWFLAPWGGDTQLSGINALFTNEGTFQGGSVEPTHRTVTISTAFDNRGEVVAIRPVTLNFTGAVAQVQNGVLEGGSWVAHSGGRILLPGVPPVVRIRNARVYGSQANMPWLKGVVQVTQSSRLDAADDIVFEAPVAILDGSAVTCGPGADVTVPLNTTVGTSEPTSVLSYIEQTAVISLQPDPPRLITPNLIVHEGLRPGGPDAPGPFNLVGNLTMMPTGIIEVELGGLVPEEEHDRMSIVGSAALEGTLDLRLLPGFVPQPGQAFTVLTASAGRSGTFSAVMRPAALPQGIKLQVDYTANSVVLTAVATCYANCDGSTVDPVLNVDDFTCFINEFAAAQNLPHEQQVSSYANCDGSTIAPALNVDDFTCFINEFAAGCP